MKRLIFLSLACLIAVFAITHNGQTQTQSYYSGDAINFNNSLYVGSTNTGGLEVFKLENKDLKQLISIRPANDRFGTAGNFYDLKFNIEGGYLFIYTISDFSLYKYELTNDNQLVLIGSSKNTYWEWYNRVDKFGDNIVTISDRGVKVWSNDLQIINGYTLPQPTGIDATTTPSSNYNIRAYNNQDILNVQNNYLTVFSRETQQQIGRIPVNYQANPGNRQAYQDENGDLFIVDDYYAKKFTLDGRLLGSFQHLDYSGYDVAASGDSNYLYFSNGVGVVKLDKSSMKLVGSRWTTDLGGPRGWAMGLKAVDVNGDKIVVFNNSDILVLDQSLNKVAVFQATEIAPPTSVENLYLNLDHGFGTQQTNITLSGGGYFPNENLNISFGGIKTTSQTDARGHFTQNLSVPNIASGLIDIKVVGVTSNLSYSTSFRVQ
jgi:hypothetical protein